MLKDDFYKVISKGSTGDQSFKSTILIDKNHDIFKGHFPEIPVVPGVCMMAMVKELLADHIQKPLLLKKASILKFLSLINPMQHTQVDITIKYSEKEDGTYVANGSISAGELVFFKITQAVYQ